MGVQFFFDSAKHKISQTFKYVFGEKSVSMTAVKTQNLYDIYVKPFGWLNSLYVIAEKGIFKIDGYNQIDSVKHTNLYKVLSYLSWTTATNEYESKVQEKIHNPNKIT